MNFPQIYYDILQFHLPGKMQINLQGLVQIPFLLWKLPWSLNRIIHFFCVLIIFFLYSYHAPCLGSRSQKLILRGRFAGKCFIKEMLSEETSKWMREVGEGKERAWARVSLGEVPEGVDSLILQRHQFMFCSKVKELSFLTPTPSSHWLGAKVPSTSALCTLA